MSPARSQPAGLAFVLAAYLHFIDFVSSTTIQSRRFQTSEHREQTPDDERIFRVFLVSRGKLMLRKVSQTTVATLATLVFVGITVSGAFAAWYVAAGYSSPQFIEGPFADYSDCNYAAAGYNERQPNWAFHCEARYSPSISSLAASCSGTCFTLVYAAHDRDRVLAGPYPSLGPCQLEAANFRTLNDDVSPSTDGVDFSRYMCRPSYGVRV